MAPTAPPALLGTLLDHLDEIVYSLRLCSGSSPSATVEFVSSRVTDVLGYDPKAFLTDQMLWWSLIHPEDSSELSASTERIFSAGRPAVWSYRIRHCNGNYRWIEDRVVPLERPDGGFDRVLGVARDVTARVVERAALLESEQRFRDLVDSSPDGVILVEPEGSIRLANREAERIFGYSRGELVGASIERLVPPDVRAQHRDHRHRYVSAPEFRPMGSGRLLSAQRRDGSTFPAEISLSPLNAAGGAIRCVIRDVTERIKADEALRTSEEHYRSLFEDNLTANYVADESGRITTCNRAFAQLMGFDSVAATEGSHLQTLFSEPAEYVALLAALQTTPLMSAREWQLRRRDGTPVFVVQSVMGIFGVDCRLQEIRGHLFDDTARQAVHAQLRQAQKMEAVGQLAGGIAHDFNNVLTVVLGQASLLRENLAASGGSTAPADEIIRSGERAAALTRQLLAFSRKQILQPTVFELDDVVTGVSSMLPRLIGEPIQLRVNTGAAGTLVRADRNQIEQIITNLVVNARDAMPEGGAITVGTDTVAAAILVAKRFGAPSARMYARLSVQDTGFGMDAAVAARVFEPFFTTKAFGKGTGLGLSTVYGIVKQSGGFIDVASTPGYGSTFTVYLPVVTGVEVDPVMRPAIPEAAPPDAGTVMIVEDDPAVQAVAAMALAGAGYDVVACAGGREALDTAGRRSSPVDVLLTDLVMADIDGQRLAEAMLQTQPDLRVVFMSGYSPDAVSASVILDRAHGFVQKPFTPSALIGAVRQARRQIG